MRRFVGGAFLNLVKPVGPTTRVLSNGLQAFLGDVKVGHVGTLDPAAGGVVPVALGQSCSLLPYLRRADKVYQASIKLGVACEGGDVTGRARHMTPLASGAGREIIGRLPRLLNQRFVGKITQRPPEASAVKIGGRRAYELLAAKERVVTKLAMTPADASAPTEPGAAATPDRRQLSKTQKKRHKQKERLTRELDEEVMRRMQLHACGSAAGGTDGAARTEFRLQMPARAVTVFSAIVEGTACPLGPQVCDTGAAGGDGAPLEAPGAVADAGSFHCSYPEVRVRLHVSSGTYVRSLAEDLGAALGERTAHEAEGDSTDKHDDMSIPAAVPATLSSLTRVRCGIFSWDGNPPADEGSAFVPADASTSTDHSLAARAGASSLASGSTAVEEDPCARAWHFRSLRREHLLAPHSPVLLPPDAPFLDCPAAIMLPPLPDFSQGRTLPFYYQSPASAAQRERAGSAPMGSLSIASRPAGSSSSGHRRPDRPLQQYAVNSGDASASRAPFDTTQLPPLHRLFKRSETAIAAAVWDGVRDTDRQVVAGCRAFSYSLKWPVPALLLPPHTPCDAPAGAGLASSRVPEPSNSIAHGGASTDSSSQESAAAPATAQQQQLPVRVYLLVPKEFAPGFGLVSSQAQRMGRAVIDGAVAVLSRSSRNGYGSGFVSGHSAASSAIVHEKQGFGADEQLQLVFLGLATPAAELPAAVLGPLPGGVASRDGFWRTCELESTAAASPQRKPAASHDDDSRFEWESLPSAAALDAVDAPKAGPMHGYAVYLRRLVGVISPEEVAAGIEALR